MTEIEDAFRYQIMPPLLEGDRRRLKESIERKGLLKDKVPEVDENGRLLDGFNRHEICAELGISYKPKRITDLAEDEKWDYVWAVNVPRRHLTTEQKRELIRERLRRHPEESDRAIRAQLGLHNMTVGAVRRALEDADEIIQTTRKHQRPYGGRHPI